MDQGDSGIGRRAMLAGGLGAALTMSGAVPGPLRGAPAALRARTPTIFATGGSFLPLGGGRPVFPHYLMSLARNPQPRICWLGAASGENPQAFAQFAKAMTRLGCNVSHFNIFRPETLDFTAYLLDHDIVYVNGGSTRNLMAMWRDWGFDRALRAAWSAGVVMAGHSAGLICWFQSGLTESYPLLLGPVKAMGFLPGSADPHYDMRPDRRTRFRQLIADGALDSPGLALDQDAGVLFRGTEIVELVAAKPKAAAFRLTRTAGGYDERALPIRYIGG